MAARRAFIPKHSDYIYRGEEYQLNDITPEQVEEACKNANNTAGGMDGWQPSEMKLLSATIYKQIAELLNLIEGGRIGQRRCWWPGQPS